jgi:hypothetical protein
MTEQPATSGPSFLFIGAAKAGSNWFMEILWEHPSVFVPPNKGTRFFNRHYERGFSWYEGFFSRACDRRIAGEVCEDYLNNPEALARIHEYRPDMRLICCLRNPYERAVSSWRFFARNGLGQPTLTAQAERSPELFLNGHYHTQLQFARSLFRQEQILILLYDDLATQPEETARRVYEHIGVDPDFVPPSLYRRVNPGGRPRIPLLARIVHDIHMHSWGSSRIASNLIGLIKRARPVRGAVRALLYDERPETGASGSWREVLPEFPRQVVARYEQEISAIERLLGRDLSSWRASSRRDSRESRRTSQRESIARPESVAAANASQSVSSETAPPRIRR